MANVSDQNIISLGAPPEASDPIASLTIGLVDTSGAIAILVEALAELPPIPPSLFLDLEGANLSRHGSLSILQIHVSPAGQTFLIDVHTLGNEAFTTPGTSGQTLKTILESTSIPKVFFDVRNDSDALFSHYGINLACIHDLQLMELASRNFGRKFVSGLAKCIDRDLPLTARERKTCKETKEKGLNLFAPERGGSYEVFNLRPLPEAVSLYCIQDVYFMPRLWKLYNSKLTATWKAKVLQAGKDRVASSKTKMYVGHGQHKALAPAGWK
ncbi:uncharacterized protein RCO7_11470 [Rhynchosporium graminicola]|uniref:3'-5' exonuclease domain-containing protein n=1 Tax=Rhynchosporium graminicola TaxID=2792576 RepID=A0A1E1LQT6_9HELO|nr:uncharacterized protein RCO7_11470 [Rhynchosporium commune]